MGLRRGRVRAEEKAAKVPYLKDSGRFLETKILERPQLRSTLTLRTGTVNTW